MKRWLMMCSAVGVFGLGVVAGVFLENRAKAQLYRSMLVNVVTDPAREGLLRMTLLAEGRTDAVFELSEGQALLCASPIKPEYQTPNMRNCALELKAFYEKYPEPRAALQRRRPEDAERLGLSANP